MRINIYSEINDELLHELGEQLEYECDKLEIHMNSAGGSVMLGLKVISMLHSKGVPTECHIEFLAASMAADISMTCDKVYMNKYGLLMFHNAWSPKDYLTEKENEYLRLQSEAMCKMVSDKRNIDYDVFVEYCNDEKWFTAEEAMKAGLIDGITDMNTELNDEVMDLYSNKSYDLILDVYKKINNKMEDKIEEEVKKLEETLESVELNEYNKLKEELESIKSELNSYREKEQLDKNKKLEESIDVVLVEALSDGKISDKSEWSELLKEDFNKFSGLLKKLPSNKKSFDVNKIINKSVNYNDEKSNWKYMDWSKKDPKSLLKMLKENKSEYCRLYKEQFGTDYKD